MLMMAIDVGTSACKVGVFSADGLVSSAGCEYEVVSRQPGWVEIDPDTTWRKIKDAVRRVVHAEGVDPAAIRAVSFSSMGEAVVPVRLDRTLVGPSILIHDVRGEEQARRLAEAFDPAKLFGVNPNIVGPHFTFAKLMWLRENEPEQHERTEKYLLWGDFLGFMFGAEAYATKSLANRTLLFDAFRGDWSDELLRWSGIDREKLGRIVDSGVQIGVIDSRIARELGLPADLALVSGGHDQGCNSLGCGCLNPGDVVVGMGTYECYTPTFAWPGDLETFRAEGMCIENHVVGGLYMSFLYHHSASLVNWFKNTFAPELGADAMERLNAELPDAPGKLLFLPHIEPPAWPRYLGDTAGVFVGMKPGTGRGDMFKALLEGITFSLVGAVEAMRRTGTCPAAFLASGGTSRSDRWMQIRADVMGIPFIRLATSEGSLTGAAILAGVHSGLFKSNAEAVSAYVRKGRTFTPDLRRHERYRERVALYNRLLPALHPLLRDVNALEA